MALKKKKYYVVWVGVEPGIYDSWSECQLQIKNYQGARYKSFETIEDATAAYRGSPEEHIGVIKAIVQGVKQNNGLNKKVSTDALLNRPTFGIAVDGACSGNPGVMEYRAVDIATGIELFRRGVEGTLIGTNNIAEYLALIHVCALLKQRGDTTTPIYSDSRTALSWLRRRHSKSLLANTPQTAKVLGLLERADAWNANNAVVNPIYKWDTDSWGEIPADFGRK